MKIKPALWLVLLLLTPVSAFAFCPHCKGPGNPSAGSGDYYCNTCKKYFHDAIDEISQEISGVAETVNREQTDHSQGQARLCSRQ